MQFASCEAYDVPLLLDVPDDITVADLKRRIAERQRKLSTGEAPYNHTHDTPALVVKREEREGAFFFLLGVRARVLSLSRRESLF